MINKIVLQGLVIVILFFSTWMVLRQVDWMSVLRVKIITEKTEVKLGEIFWEIFKKSETEYQHPLVIQSIDSIVTKICVANKIDRHLIKEHVIDKDEINAFALPDGHLIIYTGLIVAAENPEELSGVICHEIAHVELDHVMKKLVKEVGLSVLISMTAGNSGSEMIRKTAKMLSSTAFDRSLEKEADIKAIEYLAEAKISPAPFADFLYKLAGEENEVMKYLSWISTHPDSKERAAYIIEHSKDLSITNEAVLAQETWDVVQDQLKGQLEQ